MFENYDYAKEGDVFIKELIDGKFKIEILPNMGQDFSEKEEGRVKAFSDYLQSASFQMLQSGDLRQTTGKKFV